MLIRLWWLIRKELQALMGNTQGRFLLIMPVLLQTALFPFAATLEVTGNTLAIYNQDGGAQSRELLERLTHMPAFTTIIPEQGEAGMTEAITGQQALLGLIIPGGFFAPAGAGRTCQGAADHRRPPLQRRPGGGRLHQSGDRPLAK